MLEYQDPIAPDPMDPLHDLLDDLGPAPSVASLLGICKKLHTIAHADRCDITLELFVSRRHVRGEFSTIREDRGVPSTHQ